MPAQIGEQLGLTLLEALDTELKPVAVALAEAVVVELAYEGGKVGVLERPRQLRRLQQVGLPDGERAALRGPGGDVVAAGIADEVPRFPAWGGRAASEDGVGRRGTGGGDLGGTGEISPGVGAPRNFLTCPTARESSHRPGRAYRSRFGASRGGTSRCVTSRGHKREISRGHRTLAGAARVPRRHPSEIHVSEQEKTRNERGRRRDRETYHRNGDTFTVANGVVAPVALPGCSAYEPNTSTAPAGSDPATAMTGHAQ